METDVYFARKDRELLLAYKNAKKQCVFLPVLKADITPKLGDILITNTSCDIQTIIKDYFEFDVYDCKTMDIGIKTKNIWKPFLMGDMGKELNFDVYDLCRAKRDLSVLIQKLQDILLYIEPSAVGLQTYSHKLRELLILACTEFECSMKNYELGKNARTNDYVKILDLVDLKKYKIELAGYSERYLSRPFSNWEEGKTTQTLSWYSAYTETKHNRREAFKYSTLQNCIDAISANLIMFSIRYSPMPLYNESDVCSSLVRNTFALQFEKTRDFYIPIFEGKQSYQGSFGVSYTFKNGKHIDYVYDIHELVPFEERILK